RSKRDWSSDVCSSDLGRTGSKWTVATVNDKPDGHQRGPGPVNYLRTSSLNRDHVAKTFLSASRVGRPPVALYNRTHIASHWRTMPCTCFRSVAAYRAASDNSRYLATRLSYRWVTAASRSRNSVTSWLSVAAAAFRDQLRRSAATSVLAMANSSRTARVR